MTQGRPQKAAISAEFKKGMMVPPFEAGRFRGEKSAISANP